jgi:hypothetical protein
VKSQISETKFHLVDSLSRTFRLKLVDYFKTEDWFAEIFFDPEDGGDTFL